MRNIGRSITTASFVVTFATSLFAQGPPPTGQVPPAAIQADLPPATKLEGFKPEAGSVLTLGYDELGRIGSSMSAGPISVSVRQMRDSKGNVARGLVVEVIESQYRQQRSFVDADEIPELLKGLDALLAIKENPTQFKMFEVQYRTKGELELHAFSDSRGRIQFLIRVGRILTASRGIDAGDMLKLRGMFDAALQKLDVTGSGK